jgi:Putative Ig domain
MKKSVLVLSFLLLASSAFAQNQSATATFSLVVNAPPIVISTTTIPNGVVGVAYSQPLLATGGSGTLTWSVASGALPAGLSLSNGGVIGGTPTATGVYNFTAEVKDSSGQTKSQAYGVSISSPLSITTTSIPDATVGQAFTFTLKASGGTSPYTWSIVSGTLPAGLSLDAGTGVISGTPTAAGTSTVTFKVTDSGK